MTYGGAGAGAVIGTILLPGIGTVIGGALGGFFGSLFGPSLQELQQKVHTQIDEAFENAINDVESKCRSVIEKSTSAQQLQLLRVIDRYVQQYDALVKQMIREDKAEAQKMKQLEADCHVDLEKVQEFQVALQQQQESLKHL